MLRVGFASSRGEKSPLNRARPWSLKVGLALCVLLAATSARADLSAFRYVGDFSGHHYYVSIDPMTWNAARSLCASIPGGHLATISSATENAYVADCDLDGTHTGLWIGLSDAAQEGAWQWVTGESFDYQNWVPNQPDGGFGESAVSINPSHMSASPGRWHDQPANGELNSSMPCVLELETDLSAFRYVGDFSGHHYYVSIDPMTWNAARSLCASIPGGHLATISSATENAYVADCDLDGTHTGLWIGLSDAAQEGAWQWVTGESFDYQNWVPNQPDGGFGESAVSINPSHMSASPGRWHDQPANGELNSSMPCVLELETPSPTPGCLSPALSIPDADPDGVSSTIHVSEGFTVAQVTVDVNIPHTYLGDLVVELRHGTKTVRLHDQTGGGSDNLVGNYPGTLTVDGPGSLGEFAGASAAGDWTLFVADVVGGDTGQISEWCLHLTGAGPTTPCVSPALSIPDADPDGVSSTIHVSESFAVAQVTVDVNIPHTYLGDLVVELRHGTKTVRLHDQTGGGSDNLVGNYPGTLTVDGPGSLGEFAGTSAAGDWTLFVADMLGGDTGQISEWCLHLTSVAGAGDAAVGALRLAPATPNPARGGRCSIHWSIGSRQPVTLEVFDVAGRKVRALLDGQMAEPGEHLTSWDGRDAYGNPVDANVYFYRLRAGPAEKVQRVIVLR